MYDTKIWPRPYISPYKDNECYTVWIIPREWMTNFTSICLEVDKYTAGTGEALYQQFKFDLTY